MSTISKTKETTKSLAAQKIQHSRQQKSGSSRLIPESLFAYVELTRFHKPAGLLGFYLPYMIALFFAANLDGGSRLAPLDVLKASAIFLLDCVLIRSFGCAWNDTMDQDLDRKVARCKSRPVARGAISTTAGVTVTLVIAFARLVMVWLIFPEQAVYHALLNTILAFIYPLMKRISNYPQVLLGTAVGYATIFVYVAVGGDLNDTHNLKALVALTLAQTLWNITYDTVYSFQDLPDDLKAGIKSMGVRFHHVAKPFLSVLILAKAFFLIVAGVSADLNVGFFTGCLLAIFGALRMLYRLNINDPKSCRWFFVNSQWVVSGSLLVGLACEYAIRASTSIY